MASRRAPINRARLNAEVDSNVAPQQVMMGGRLLG